jgi:hypothetical protein
MELYFNKGIAGKEDKLTNIISVFSDNFMVLNCMFNIGFETSDNIAFALMANGIEINRIALGLFKDQYLTVSNMININMLIAKPGSSVQISLIENGSGPFDLKINYI